MPKAIKNVTVHFVCVNSGAIAASGTGRTEGHAILAATNKYSSAIGRQQSWVEIFSIKSQPNEARCFEVFIAEGEFVAGDGNKLADAGERWGMVRLQDYVEPDVEEEDDYEAA